jgi:hypothetical protein
MTDISTNMKKLTLEETNILKVGKKIKTSGESTHSKEKLLQKMRGKVEVNLK